MEEAVLTNLAEADQPPDSANDPPTATQLPGPASDEVYPADTQFQNHAELAFPKEPPRRRSKAPCFYPRRLRCLTKTPADAHHLKFAQPRTLRRKVSDADRTINRFNTAMDELGGESANLPAPDS
jgi:hypothetical protein